MDSYHFTTLSFHVSYFHMFPEFTYKNVKQLSILPSASGSSSFCGIEDLSPKFTLWKPLTNVTGKWWVDRNPVKMYKRPFSPNPTTHFQSEMYLQLERAEVAEPKTLLI